MNCAKAIKFKIFSVREETTAFERVCGKTCIERIVYANKDCKFIKHSFYYETNGAVIEWRNPPVYAEALLNKALSRH